MSASKDRTVKLVDAATGKSRLTFSGMDRTCWPWPSHPTASRSFPAGFEPGLHWWNPQTGERTKKQNGHDVAVHELSFGKSGKLLASAGGDKTVRLWNGSSGEPIRTLLAGSMVYAVALRPDGVQVAAGCADGLVRVWDAVDARLLLTLTQLPAEGDVSEWLAITPEGYVAGSDAALAKAHWRSGAGPLPPSWPATVTQPARVAAAWRGEKVAEPK